MTDILLSVEELSKRYASGKLAIDAVSFGLSRGNVSDWSGKVAVARVHSPVA